MSDWYRKRTWTAVDEADFWFRLKRARASNKPQYLRIQASYLADNGSPELRRAALKLLTLLILEFPSRIELSCALAQRGDIHRLEGRIEEALIDYRAALEQERVFPNAKTIVWLRFGSLIALRKLHTQYEEASKVLCEREADAMFPVDHFRLHAIRSLIAEDCGLMDEARTLADFAHQSAAKDHSGFRYHPKLGLVGHTSGNIREILEGIEERR